MDMDYFLVATVYEQFWKNLANLGIDWAMYNPNYDFMLYNAILF